MLMGFDKAEQRMKVCGRKKPWEAEERSERNESCSSMSCLVFVSPAGPDGETGQPSLWRWLRESEEPLSQTAAVPGDGETEHNKTAR